MKFVSAGVYVREIDLSLYIPTLSSTIAAMVLTASKGPINERTFVSNPNAFVATFGQPHPDHLGTYAAMQYLRRGRQLWVVRVAGTDAAVASADMAAVKLGYVVSSATVANNTQSFAVTNTAKTIKFEVTDSRTGVATVLPAQEITLALPVAPATTLTVKEAAADLAAKMRANAVLSTYLTAVSHTVSGVEKLYIVAKQPSPLVSFRVLAGTSNDASSVLGFAITAAPTNLAHALSLSSGSQVNPDFNVSVSAVGPDGESVATAYTFSTSFSAFTVDITWDAVAGATSYNVYLSTGTDAPEFFENTPDLGVRYTLGTWTGLTLDGQGLAPTVAANIGTTVNLPAGQKFVIKARSAGTWANALTVQTTVNPQQPFTFDLGVYQSSEQFSAVGNFKGLRTELHQALSLDDTAARWVGTVMGTVNSTPLVPVFSADGRSESLAYELNADDTLLTANSGYMRFVMPQVTAVTLSGGDDGLGPNTLSDADFIGVTLGATRTGLQLFRNPEDIDINLLMVPGQTSPAIINEMLVICEERGDAMCIVDTPDGYSVQQVVDWHNGAGAFSDHQSFSSSYGAMYYSWIKIFDAYNNVEVWTPPSGHVSAVYAYTDFIAETWFAPAGFNRAHIVAGLSVRYSPDLGERELMYGNANAVNPIVQFPKDGITVWGQRTLQRAPTALDRVNVRRLLLYMRKVVARAVKYLVFEPNDSATWRQFVRLVEPFCATIKSRRGIYDFRVICDETTNTPDLIDQNIMTGRIYIKPTKAAEVINVDFVLTTTGAKFEEILF